VPDLRQPGQRDLTASRNTHTQAARAAGGGTSRAGTHKLHALLAEAPSELTFRAIVALLDSWPGDSTDALATAARALEAWPDEHRLAPWSWCRALAEGRRKPTWSLVRAVGMCSGHIGCESFALEQLDQEVIGPVVTHLYLDRYSALGEYADAGLLASAHWPRLRCVYGLDCEDEGMRALLASDLLSRLEGIELFLDRSPHSAQVVPGLTRRADRLRELHLCFRHHKDIRPLLADELLPNLQGLYLRGEWFTGEIPEHFRALAELPVLARLRRLLLGQFPQEVVTGILARPDLALERLELRNREYMRNLVDYQQNACRLDAQGVEALARSAALPGLAQLTVQNERVGDVVLKLVEAATPGRLETLELINVGLTDEGVAQLARMPQLSGISVLSLQENNFTAAGLAVLLRSPHLGKLRRLALGGRPPWSPYYADNPTQALGDNGVAVLASSGLLAQLDELALCSAAVGPTGVAALAAAEAPRLVRLDLANNPLGSTGAAGLGAARYLSGLRELDLSQCGLDDAAMRHLARLDFRSLVALGLGYNSIGPAGARHLADAAGLAGVRRLNLHDNFIGDEGLIALAGSDAVAGLIELDLEQDVWNYRNGTFGDEAARAVASSQTFARLDSFFAGVIDEYHGGPCQPPFRRPGRELIAASAHLRPEARLALLLPEWEEEEEQEAQAPINDNPNQFFLHYTPREVERSRREQDFRGLPPPELSMDERQWLEATDPAWMLEFLGDRAGQRKRRLFACACARRALRLQPNEALQAGLDIAEQFADGQAGEDDLESAHHVVREARSDDHTDPLRGNIGAAVQHALTASEPEAVSHASQCAIRAAIEDMRRRRPGSVAQVSYTPEHAAQAALLRCLFGNPHRPVRLDPAVPAWNDGTVVKLARAIDEARAFEQLPILADALEEAGCTDAEVLGHCRQSGEHAHGCWVVDMVLNQV
jgi:hypothetical protein